MYDSWMTQTTVSLFVPCLVDQAYPEIGFAVIDILEHLGYGVRYEPGQTCCGQPGFNAGDRVEARRVAERFLDVFAGAEVIVCPSGSCTSMVRKFYPDLFAGTPRAADAERVAGRVFEFSEFLVREERTEAISGSAHGRVGFHNSCHSYRELRLVHQARTLLRRVSGCEHVDLPGEPVCCGFGGLFSFKFAEIAATMGQTRVDSFVQLGVETLVSNDPGCILHMEQEARAKGLDLRIRHLAVFLAEAMQLGAAGRGATAREATQGG
jgi:L-lactate dehydrogenase complex protein LldE